MSIFIKSVIFRIFLMEFIHNFVLIYPFYIIMFGERGNISAAGVGILLAVWQIVSVVSEVPTGVVADKISKKWSLVLSKALRLIAFSFWLFVPSFLGYLIGFILWGIADAFSSGTTEAYIYESLPQHQKKDFSKIYSRASSMTMLSFTLAYLLSFVIGPNYNFLLLMSILVSLISLLICLTLPDNKIGLKSEIKPQILKAAINNIKNSKSLRNLFFGAILIQSLAVMLIEYIPLYYKQVGTPVNYVPLLLAAGNAITVFLFWFMHGYERQLTKYRILILITATALFVWSFTQGTIIAVIGMLLFVRLIRVLVVNYEAMIQHSAVDEARATVGSIYSFSARIIAALVIFIIGLVSVSDIIVVPVRWAVILTILLFILFEGLMLKRWSK
jgi:MFS family permease